MEWSKLAIFDQLILYHRWCLVPNNMNMTSAKETSTARQNFSHPSAKFLQFNCINQTSQNIISRMEAAICPDLLNTSALFNFRPVWWVSVWLRGLSIDTPFFLPVVFSPSAAPIPREKCSFFSPTQCSRKHLPWCEMCPYRMHAEVERGVEEFYTLRTKLSSSSRSKAGYSIPDR